MSSVGGCHGCHDEANRLLGAGALFEVSFPFAIAAAVTDLGEDESLDAIDEALEARIVAPTDEFDRYAFTHALFRHTLVEELNPSRQVRMHRAIAEAIEKSLRGAPDAGTAATLARHYLRSAAMPGAERGVPYAIAVADDAAGRYAAPRGAHGATNRARAARTARRTDDRDPVPHRQGRRSCRDRSRRPTGGSRRSRAARRRRRRHRRRV